MSIPPCAPGQLEGQPKQLLADQFRLSASLAGLAGFIREHAANNPAARLAIPA